MNCGESSVERSPDQSGLPLLLPIDQAKERVGSPHLVPLLLNWSTDLEQAPIDPADSTSSSQKTTEKAATTPGISGEPSLSITSATAKERLGDSPVLRPRAKKRTKHLQSESSFEGYDRAITMIPEVTTPAQQSQSLKLPAPDSTSPLVNNTFPISNHVRRLRSGMCREEWILPKKSASISEADEVLTVTQLVEEHARHFPLSVMLIRGLEGRVSPKTAIHVHFLKLRKVIDASDVSNQRYLIPHNSSVKFGLVYCPGVKTESYLFERVSDIIHAQDLPKVVTCTKRSKGKNEGCSVGVNEVLIVMEILGPPSGKATKKNKLRVFSFTHKQEKVLSGDVVGRFTTDPKLAAFHIQDLLKYVPDPFPVSVRLFLDGEEASAEQGLLPGVLLKDPVLLLDNTVEKSLVCTCDVCADSTGPGVAGGSTAVVEIPVNQDILVSFLGGKDFPGKSNTLNAKTLALWKELLSPEGDDVAVQRLGDTSTQHKLFTLVRKDCERCQFIQAPPRLQKGLPPMEGSENMEDYQALSVGSDADNQYMPLVSAPSIASSDYGSSEEDDPFITRKKVPAIPTPAKDQEKDHGYQTRLVRRIEALELRIAGAAPQDKVQRLSRRVEALELRFSVGAMSQSDPQPTSKREEALQREVESLRTAYKTLEDDMKAIQREMKEMVEKMRTMPMAIANGHAELNHQEKHQSREENLAELRGLETEQISKLLEALGLHRYKVGFVEELVTGEILAECDEEVLEQDLGMSDATHRSKMMSVIRGESSPITLMADYAYVRFKPTA